MHLVIVESPTKARTLKRYLGAEYSVEASMGHIRDLPKSKLSIDIAHDFAPEYVKSEGKTAVISKLKKLAKDADKIYLATDPDREGEAIAWHVLELLKDSVGKKKSKPSTKENSKIQTSNSNKDTKTLKPDALNPEPKFVRATFHEITKGAIMHAIENPGELNMALVDAQQARRVLDRLVGYYLSPVLWKKVRRGLSAGRVQSVALRLIVDREREREAFVPVEYWEIYVDLATEDRPQGTVEQVKVLLWKKDGKELIVSKKEEADPIVAQLKEATYTVADIAETKRVRAPFAPFTTSTLQQAAANRLGFTSKRTMKLAQDLYEHGVITYHRTDSVNLSTSAVEAARSYIGSTFGATYVADVARTFTTKSKNAQEAHEAIRPTDVAKRQVEAGGTFDDSHVKLYDLIWRRFVATQMKEAVYNQTTVLVDAKVGTQHAVSVAENKEKIQTSNSKNQTSNKESLQSSVLSSQQETENQKPKAESYTLKANGSVLLFDGWMKIFPGSEDTILPKLTVGQPLTYQDLQALQKFTQPPARYNDASLVKQLEKLGIGRPSTYASIINVLEIRGYVEREAKAFKPTAVGTTVTDFLVKNFPKELDFQFTANMEDDLDAIARGEKEWVATIKTFFGPFEKTVQTVTADADRAQVPVEEMGISCPNCGEGKLVIRTGRFGKFVSCNRYPGCTFTGKLIFKVEGLTCPDCGQGEIREKNSKRGKFYGCSRYPSCRYTSWQKPGTDENPVVMAYVANVPKTEEEKKALAKERKEKDEEKKAKMQKKSIEK